MSKMGILKNILKPFLQILKKTYLRIDVDLYLKIPKFTIGRMARFREIYDRKKFRTTSLSMRTS